jgi:hypothetical protein
MAKSHDQETVFKKFDSLCYFLKLFSNVAKSGAEEQFDSSMLSRS